MTDTDPTRPLDDSVAEVGFERKDMVSWLSPKELLTTAARVGLSAVFGVYADKREIQAALPPGDVFGYVGSDELWFDYISDLGDGFSATYDLARHLAGDELTVQGADGGPPVTTPAGRFLVMGGDQVYPTATMVEYEDRMVGPYRAALPWSDEERDLWAIPGNHDWYDGLSSFLRVFCQRDWIGAWKTRQSRSYFAIRLPHRWWLWGIDIQFDTYIDDPQRNYFETVIGPQLEPGDSIILCSAKPNWTKVTQHPDAFANLDYFNRRVVKPSGAQIRLYLTGDSHHYARYEPVVGSSPQLVTAGGGGAFLSATHHLPDKLRLPPDASRDRNKTKPAADFRRTVTYPDVATSKRLRRGVLNLPFANVSFWALIGATYGAVGWIAAISQRDLGPAILDLMADLRLGTIYLEVARTWQGALLWAAIIFGLVGFTQEKAPLKRWGLGGLHGLAHVLLSVICVRAAADIAAPIGGNLAWAMFFLLLFSLGGLAGSMLMALYLVIADHFGCNTNELFAAQRIVDYKCFVRLHLAKDGSLTIYPVAVDKVGRKWRFEPEGSLGDPWFVASRPGTPPRLIEPPVTIPKS